MSKDKQPVEIRTNSSFAGSKRESPLFVLILVATMLIVGALTFLPALALGPIVEHLTMLGGN